MDLVNLYVYVINQKQTSLIGAFEGGKKWFQCFFLCIIVDNLQLQLISDYPLLSSNMFASSLYTGTRGGWLINNARKLLKDILEDF